MGTRGGRNLNQKDDRVSFDEALVTFEQFLSSQDLHTSLLWLTRNRITGHKGHFWIYRPEELSSADPSKKYFEESRKANWNLAICAFTQFKNFTLAYVERGRGESRMLNLSIHTTKEWNYHFVQSKAWWMLIRIYCHLRGLTPFLKYTDMPPG